MNEEHYRGIFSTAMLRERQVSWRQQEKLMSERKLCQIRYGWYATNDAHQDVIRAIKHSGQVGCISGCKVHGLWIPPKYQKELCTCLPKHTVIDPGLAKRGITAHRGGNREISVARSVEDCLVDVTTHHDPETALVVLELVVNNRFITFSDGEALVAGLTARKREPLRFFECGAQSGSGTCIRLFSRRRNIKIKPQELLRNIGWVDLLVGKSSIVEYDGRTYHFSESATHNDWARNEYANLWGYSVIRLSYGQTWDEWEQIQEYLEEEIKTHRHGCLPQPI